VTDVAERQVRKDLGLVDDAFQGQRKRKVFSRVREITDAFGARLQVSVEPNGAQILVVLERLDRDPPSRTILDSYGAEVLSGYIMAARLAVPNDLPEERVDGAYGSSFELARGHKVSLVLRPDGGREPFHISATFWDLLYAELCMVVAHARELGRRASERTIN
jgi:hypothetical protein